MNKLQIQKILVIFLAVFSCVKAESRGDESSTQSTQSNCDYNRNPLNLKACNYKRNIIDSEGNFLKILCRVHQGYNYNDAEHYCLNNGMDLLIIENQVEYDEVSKFTFEHWPSRDVWGAGAGIWINGRKINNEWFSYRNLKKEPIGTGIKIVEDPQQNGNCAVLKKNYSNFELKNYDCKKGYHFYCQHKAN